MTYCVGICVDEGLVMLSDTRTNAGLDNISTFSKMQVLERPASGCWCCSAPATSR
jgi:putative proteasome-type protease